MATTHEEEVFISFALNQEGKFVQVQRGTRITKKLREKPQGKNLVKVATIEVYRDETRGSSTPEKPAETTGTESEPDPKKRPPCWCFVNPPGAWVCGCEPPDCPE
jgi:hypothetical protein